MARHEQDREDLLAEATALVERAELNLAGHVEPVVVGFRRDGAASVYFGGETAYHFNSAGQLRRAYQAGLLLKAEHGQLVSLDRRRVPGEVQLVRHELSDQETCDFLDNLAARLVALQESLSQGEYQIVGQVPAAVDVVGPIRRWLDALSFPPPIAATPRASR